MERHEIEAELDEVERDLAYIARRAHIAASNLRSVAEAYGRKPPQTVAAITAIASDAERIRAAIAEARVVFKKPAPVAAEEGGAE